jgi:adenylosuccinate lyase
MNGLAGLGASLYKFAFDLRLLQSPTIGEWGEPFGEKQVGSSAMPFKRNPINAEKIDSLARLLAQMPAVAWQNAAHSLLERTLDDSANRRTLLPESLLITDELLITASKILRGLQINQNAISHNLTTYAPFASTERLLMALVKAGADRQEMHERLRNHAMTAWQSVGLGQPNPLLDLLLHDPLITGTLSPQEVKELMGDGQYVGSAPQRARHLANVIRITIQNRN